MLEVRSSGGKTYYQRYTDERGRERQFKVGPADVLTLRQARRKAQQIKAAAILGSNPQEERQQRRAIPTLQIFVNDHYLPFVKTYKRSWQTDETILRVHVLPHLGRLCLDEVTTATITEVVASMRSKNYAPGTVARVVVILRFLFNLATKMESTQRPRQPGCRDYQSRRMFKEIASWTKMKSRGWLRRSLKTKIRSPRRQSSSCF